ncbi:MAG: metallophosphoesterase [Bacteroidales bacterium]|nr:metallophosphoesterase [Bacteroidales bacterium]
MKIQYCSDLHLEFEKNSKYLINTPLIVSGEVLILAGDIAPLFDERLNNPFFRFVSDHYKQVFWVPGNHEFYHKDLGEYSQSYNILVRKNINIVHNITLNYEGIRFIFTTLWSNISKEKEKFIEQRVSDFQVISMNKKPLRVSDFNQLHVNSLSFLKEALEYKTERTIVVTHHLPSTLCNYPPHNASLINEAFCVDIAETVENSHANFWIYGHSHFNQKPLIIGKTMMLTNQLGYLDLNECLNFKHNAYFSI